MWSFPLCSLKNTTVGQRDRLLEAHWTGCILLRWRKFSSANIIFSSQSKLRRSSVRKTCRKQHNEIALNWILGFCLWNFVFMWFGHGRHGPRWSNYLRVRDTGSADTEIHQVWSGELNTIIILVPTLYTMLLQIRPCHGSGRYLSAFHLRGLCSIPV